jgi:hypothetical protein
LDRLENADQPPAFEMLPCYTVDDVAEVLNMPVETVIRHLMEMRAKDREARLSGILRELEEPTHRVERPSTSAMPTGDPIFRTRAVQELMARQEEETPVIPRRKYFEDRETRQEMVMGRIILYVLMAMMIGFIAFGIVQNLRLR